MDCSGRGVPASAPHQLSRLVNSARGRAHQRDVDLPMAPSGDRHPHFSPDLASRQLVDLCHQGPFSGSVPATIDGAGGVASARGALATGDADHEHERAVRWRWWRWWCWPRSAIVFGLWDPRPLAGKVATVRDVGAPVGRLDAAARGDRDVIDRGGADPLWPHRLDLVPPVRGAIHRAIAGAIVAVRLDKVHVLPRRALKLHRRGRWGRRHARVT